MITARDLAMAAYIVGEDVARRRRHGHPVPPALVALHRRLLDAVAVDGHKSAAGDSDRETWLSAQQVAARHGVSPRTIRRNANQYRGRKLGRTWIFPPDRSS